MTAKSSDLLIEIMEEMEPKLLEFLKTKVNSFIKWDLVKFFHDNPNTTDTAEGIARYIGRRAESVKPELEKLVVDGVVEKKIINGICIYSLTKDEEMRKFISDFVSACDERHFRIKAVYHIIREMRRLPSSMA
jgi:hypothetical protein